MFHIGSLRRSLLNKVASPPGLPLLDPLFCFFLFFFFKPSLISCSNSQKSSWNVLGMQQAEIRRSSSESSPSKDKTVLSLQGQTVLQHVSPYIRIFHGVLNPECNCCGTLQLLCSMKYRQRKLPSAWSAVLNLRGPPCHES